MAAKSAPTALVTGASRGIGFAIARALVRAGAPVVLAARGRGGLEEARATLLAETPAARLGVLELDVADAVAVARAPEALAPFEAEPGPLGWLVSNAGLAESAPLLPKRPRAAGAPDPFERHLAVNFHGPRRLLEALGPALVARRDGAVVHVASSAGLVGYAYVAAYCASKHALVGLTRAAARELAPSGVRVHAVCPHYVASPMLEASIDTVVARTGRSREDARAFFARENPGGRLIEPDEVAAAVLALLRAPEAGIVLELDGANTRRVDPGFTPNPRA